ncbi:MAG: hypothetical protein WBG37_10465 [Desulfobacterales bacterium]
MSLAARASRLFVFVLIGLFSLMVSFSYGQDADEAGNLVEQPVVKAEPYGDAEDETYIPEDEREDLPEDPGANDDQSKEDSQETLKPQPIVEGADQALGAITGTLAMGAAAAG